MEISSLERTFNDNKNPKAAIMMKKYMKEHFEFLGINKPLRSQLQKQFIAENKKHDIVRIMAIASELASIPYREYYYAGIDLLQTSINKMDISHMYGMTDMATAIRPWWDSVDAINIAIKNWFAMDNNSDYLDEFSDYAANHKSIWANRISLICQLQMKDRLNTAVLDRVILNFKDSDEFFLQKAIGWILREYSKYNPGYVKLYLLEHKLKPLSVREASKYLNK